MNHPSINPADHADPLNDFKEAHTCVERILELTANSSALSATATNQLIAMDRQLVKTIKHTEERRAYQEKQAALKAAQNAYAHTRLMQEIGKDLGTPIGHHVPMDQSDEPMPFAIV